MSNITNAYQLSEVKPVVRIPSSSIVRPTPQAQQRTEFPFLRSTSMASKTLSWFPGGLCKKLSMTRPRHGCSRSIIITQCLGTKKMWMIWLDWSWRYMIISRKAEPGKKLETMRYGTIGLAKRACFFRQVVFDVKVHDVGFGRVSFQCQRKWRALRWQGIGFLRHQS